jgi:uncharacterized membrane protein
MGDLSLTNPWVLLIGAFVAWKLLRPEMERRGREKRGREWEADEDRKRARLDREYRVAMQKELAIQAAERAAERRGQR